MSEREFRPGRDDEAVLALRARVWGAAHPHCRPAFYSWLFGQAPAGTGGGIISEMDGRVVGFAGICPREARIGSTRLKVSHGLDFMVDPDLGGMLSGRVGLRTLKRHVILARKLGCDINLNFPNDNSHRMLTSDRLEYAPVFSSRLHVRPLGAIRLESGAGLGSATRVLAMTGGRAAALGATMRAALSRPANVHIEPLQRFDERFDGFWEQLARGDALYFTRDARALNWRYAEHPLNEYTILAATAAGRLLGYAVATRREVMGIDALLICDLCVQSGMRGIHEALIGALVEGARRKKAGAVVAQSTSGDPLGRALARCGFLQVPQRLNPKPFRMVAMAYTGSGQAALSPQRWAFRWGDTDVV